MTDARRLGSRVFFETLIMQDTVTLFRQTNAYAMQNGIGLGLWGFLSLAAGVGGLVTPWLQSVSSLMMLASPFLAGYLTCRFRKAVMEPQEGFSFGHAYAHTLMMGLYATLWIAVGTYVYLAFFDHGFVFDAYAAQLRQPETMKVLQESGMLRDIREMTGGKGVDGLVEMMRAIPPAQYAVGLIYMNIFIAPVLSLIIALFCRKSPIFGPPPVPKNA